MVAPINPTQLTPPRVAFIDERTGAISREWYRFFLSLLTATEANQQQAATGPNASSLLASYDALLDNLAQGVQSAPDAISIANSLDDKVNILAQTFAVAPPDLGGSTTSVSVVSTNGFAGTVANAMTTPAITISTTVTGVVKGNGTAILAALAGTDYVAPGAITTSGLTMATARLLGRTTAAAGAVEEISVGTGLSLSGGTLSNNAPDQTVTLTGGTGISISGSYPSFTITNTLPDQIVSLTGAGTTVVTGTYPNFMITSNDQFVGTVTSVSGTGTVNGITLTGTVTSSGNLTLGGTLSGVSLTTQVTGTLPIANGGTGATDAATARANLGAGTVTSVAGTGTVNGITLTGTVTSSGNLTLGGTLSNVSLASQVTGTLPVGNGGTGTATAFTSGSVVFAGGSGVYSQNNANFFWDNTNARLGLGTTGPSQRLHVRQDLNGTTGILIQNRNGSGTPVAAVQFITGGLDLSDNRYAQITAEGGGSTTMRFWTSNGAAPAERLAISAGGALTALGPYNTTVGATNRDLFVDNTGLIGYVSSVKASKTNIAPLSDTSWVYSLQPVSFNYRKRDVDGVYTDEAEAPLEYGLIAEEVEAVNPELVFYDETSEGPELRGVSYGKLMIPMLAELQALRSRVDELERSAKP